MAEEAASERNGRKRKWGKRIGIVLGALLLVIVGTVALLNSPIGKRFIADQIASVAPASGLRIEVGRIEGDIFRDAILRDVILSDPEGRFLTIPEAEVDWQPLSWLTSGLDVRKLIARRGTLLRLPELLPGDPDAPILPSFDIRIDQLAIEDFTIAAGVIDDTAHTANLTAKADVTDGRAIVHTEGQLGTVDRFLVELEAEPDGDRFDLDLDYVANQGGVIAGLLGAKAGYEAKIRGGGTWQDWRGYLVIDRNERMVGGFRLTNKAGLYGIVGRADPSAILQGLPADVLGSQVDFAAFSTLEESVLDGAVRLRGASLRVRADGAVDLEANDLDAVDFALQLTNPDLFGESLLLEGTQLAGTADGDFRDLAVDHRLTISRLVSGETTVSGIAEEGTARYDGTRWALPFVADIGRVETGTALIDPRLVDGRLGGSIILSGDTVRAESLRIAFPDANAQLAFDGNLASGRYQLQGPVAINGLTFENVGRVNAGGDIDFVLAGDNPWTLSADVRGTVFDVTNATIANLAGPRITFGGGVSLGGAGPIDFRDVSLDSDKLKLQLDGAIADGRTTLAGNGSHTDYGTFTIEGALNESGPEAVLVFANPLPAAGLADVRVALSPTENGFAIATEGDSLLGRFDGDLGLVSPADGPTRIAVERFNLWKTGITGAITLGDTGVSGTLDLSGGGLNGTIGISPRRGGQYFNVELTARNASFGGDTPISLARANIDGSGLLVDGNSTLEASVFAQGVRYGTVFIGRMAANAELENGAGTVTASLAGRRGSRFALQVNADVAPERLALAARGNFAGKAIRMPRRAVLTKTASGAWNLAETQFSYGSGSALAQGQFGGGDARIRLALDDMPLSLVDIAVADLGLGGDISGIVDFSAPRGGLPTGEARVQVDNLTRSGVVLASRPVDLALVTKLTPSRLEARAVIDDADNQRGRLQGRITNLRQSGDLFTRLNAGDLFAQLRYSGPAQALWRLAAIDAFDFTGPVSLAADVTGTLANPRVLGSVGSDDLRVQSVLSGTDIRDVSARGTFAGSRLRLTRFAGTASNGGSVSGSGVVDLANLSATRGPELDLRIAAKNAQLLDALGIDATVTGPLRIVSNGIGGTIAGKLQIDRASWKLGIAADDVSLPTIATREINAPADVAPARIRGAPWRYLINATADSRVDVDGLGLDSEWEANIRLRGTTDDPRIGGAARVVRGFYSFAGTRFELVRGRIAFDERVPIDPQIDIIAESQQNGVDVNVSVQGSATQPEIAFSSTPALPEEEILARLLFGGSITDLSATDAVQLGAALASLRGGGGLDPINQLRSAIGLDRLRIVGADPALGRSAGVALGKNIGRSFYVELITDGRGYSATEVEFRVTSWLSLLAAVSTAGRESAVVEISRDY
ncbi:translocation/assembly module TamB domain-containing protein [Parerythrobacter jejuensis]|uniref:DUF490 domain-containing protein n=1 Tax=Parerythrobacter jejuensis TaxID=795812 RepID=A0A845ARR4_9SPHN|nr:translocation/assembly module TamB domain-containing protein [Parerythrobacter jejuensis]MXP31615.1 DUF490 domain-containing protein [Parerythrobacter jejuensis]